MQNHRPYSVNTPAILWLIYGLFIIYGTTIPFELAFTNQTPFINTDKISIIPFVDPDGSRASIPDMVQNILLFIPFGYLGFFAVPRKGFTAIAMVTLLGLCLSLTVELLQLLTANRTTSTTDMLTNMLGSFAGAFCAAHMIDIIEGFLTSPTIRQYVQSKYFYPMALCALLVITASLQPFDFTLDVGIVWSSIKSIVHQPLQFSIQLQDEGVSFLRYFLFCFLLCLCLWDWKKKNTLFKGFLISSLLGVLLEASQIIVKSRMPSAQDVLVILSGSISGGLFITYWPFVFNRRVWSLLMVAATGASAAMYSLSPFQWTSVEAGMNWFPFLPYYQKTSFIALSNFIESLLIYFPMGFLLQYFNDHRRTFWIVFSVALAISFPLEYSQKWIVGRYPDITDILGALVGAIAGALACREGWKAFDAFLQRSAIKGLMDG